MFSLPSLLFGLGNAGNGTDQLHLGGISKHDEIIATTVATGHA